MCVERQEHDESLTKRIAKAKDLKRSFALTKTLWSEAEEVISLTDTLLEMIRTMKARARFKRSNYTNNLIVFLANLIKAHTFEDRWIAYSRSSRGYNDAPRYNPAHVTRNIVQIADALLELGYLEQHLGVQLGFDKYCTRVKATPKLVDLWKSYGITYDHFYEHPNSEVLILKNTKGKSPLYLDYEDTKVTNTMRENLIELNSYLEKQNITLNISEAQFEEMIKEMEEKDVNEDREFSCRAKVTPARTRLKRIFNNCTFDNGGRFYHAWWLEIPKEYRKHIIINGFKTIELDYSALHPSILYAWKGLPALEDPYAIKGYDEKYRAAIKLALLIMINAKSQKAALKAMRNKLSNQYEEFNNANKVRKLHNAIKETHAPISEYFNSNIGIELQRIDSNIAERVMLRLNGLRPIVALPVHDSFIVPDYAEEFATKIMQEEFEQALKQPIKVDSKVDELTKKIRKELGSDTLVLPATLDIDNVVSGSDIEGIGR